MSATATLISGASGSGKTSLLATAAEWVYKNHRKITRLYTCDGGGWGSKVQTLVEAGIIQVWRMRTRVGGLAGEGLVEETCMRASQGYWPERWDPASGEVAEACNLVAPTQTTYTLSCKSGHVVKVTTMRKGLSGEMKCGTCGALTSLANGDVAQVWEATPGFDGVGAICYDGLTSMSDWIMISLADRVGRNELSGEKPALGGVVRSGDINFGSNNRAHYGFAQTQAQKWLLNSSAIPKLVIPPIWTALESRVDEGVALPFYGPSISGQAKTGSVPQWAGNYLGTQIISGGKDGRREWRLYLTEYRGEDGYPHIYKTRAEAGTMDLPEYLADGDGKPFTGFNFGKFMDLMEQAKAASAARVAAEFPDAPGMMKQEEMVAASASAVKSVAVAGGYDTPKVVGAIPAIPTVKSGPVGRVASAGNVPVATAPTARPPQPKAVVGVALPKPVAPSLPPIPLGSGVKK